MRSGVRRFGSTLRHLMLFVLAVSLLLMAARDSIRGWLWPPVFPYANTKAATERARRSAPGPGAPNAGPPTRSNGDPEVIARPGLP